MPFFKYTCQKHGPFDRLQLDELHDVEDCPECHRPSPLIEKTEVVYSAPRVKVNGYYSEELGGYVGSEADKRRLMKAAGLEEIDVPVSQIQRDIDERKRRKKLEWEEPPPEFIAASKAAEAEALHKSAMADLGKTSGPSEY